MQLERERILVALNDKGQSNGDKLLLCLAYLGLGSFSVSQIKESASSLGFTAVRKINVSGALARLNGRVFRTSLGWELHPNEIGILKEKFSITDTPIVKSINKLRKHLGKLKTEDAKTFVEEAIGCAENHFHRAAIVLSWVGALHVLQAAVLATHEAAFNAEAVRRNPRWRISTKPEDISSQIKEGDFLDILAAIGFLDNNVKKLLKTCLDLRNSCGHPNKLKIDEHIVSSHIETLSLNIFSAF